eukprot:SM000058S18554  [mRNA]  locus=s58:542373:543705:- [translate_table: standard]
MAALGVAACRCRGPSPSVARAPSLLRAPPSAPGGSLAAQSARARALFLAAVKAPRLRSSRAGGQARAGLPIISSVPVIGGMVNFALNPVLLFIIYAAGAPKSVTFVSFAASSCQILVGLPKDKLHKLNYNKERPHCCVASAFHRLQGLSGQLQKGRQVKASSC